VRRRLRHIEAAVRSSGCSECRDTPPAIHAVYSGDYQPEPEYCPECGRSLSIIIRVEDEGEGAGADA
jgi:hypothetical protein